MSNMRKPSAPQASGYSNAGGSLTRRATRSFRPDSNSPSQDINQNSATLRQRSRMLYMSSPIAASAINTNRTKVVGTGLTLKTAIDRDVLGLTPETAKKWQSQTEAEFRLWAENRRNCDALGMTMLILLDRLTDFTRDAVKDLLLPVRQQENDAEAPAMRAAEVYKMRLPDSGSAKKKAPYIIHQVVTTNDLQPQGERIHATAKLRTVFCVYSPNEEEGSLMLLNLMERLRIALLKQVVIGHQFTLDTTAGLERLMYLDDTAPYYIGEMATEWILPPVQREVSPWEPNPRP